MSQTEASQGTVSQPAFLSKWRRRAALLCLAVVSIALTSVACVFGLEYACYLSDPNPAAFDYQYSKKRILISFDSISYPTSSVRLALLPADLHYEGPAPWEGRAAAEPDFRIDMMTNEWGFFSEIPHRDLTKDAPDEFRIIVVGGSGAQGHGASDLSSTFAAILQTKLNQDSKIKQSGFKARVINLAQAGCYAETNELILRKFGHDLQPDMIVYYNGANDLAQLAFISMPSLMNDYVASSLEHRCMWKDSEVSPDYVMTLNDWFPYLGRKHRLFHWLGKKLTPSHYEEQRQRLRVEFLHRWGICDTGDPDSRQARRLLEFLDITKRSPDLPGHTRTPSGFSEVGEMVYRRVPLKSFVDSLKSVKKDFEGIPIVIAWQAIGVSTQHTPDGPRVDNGTLYANWFDIDDVYRRFYRDQKEALQGYVNDQWWFFDVDERIERKAAEGNAPPLKVESIAVHLDDLGHQAVADVLFDELKPIVIEKLSERSGGDGGRVNTARGANANKIR
jgi:hypothetical protein